MPRPPRKLEPISPVKKKKKRQTKKRTSTLKERQSDDVGQSPHPLTSTAIDSTLLHQLRTRLDPIYNPPPPSPTLPSTAEQRPSLDHTPHPPDGDGGSHQTHDVLQRRASHDLDLDSLESTSKEVLIGGDTERRHKRTRKRRKRDHESERVIELGVGETQTRGEPEGQAEMVTSHKEEERSVDDQDVPHPGTCLVEYG